MKRAVLFVIVIVAFLAVLRVVGEKALTSYNQKTPPCVGCRIEVTRFGARDTFVQLSEGFLVIGQICTRHRTFHHLGTATIYP